MLVFYEFIFQVLISCSCKLSETANSLRAETQLNGRLPCLWFYSPSGLLLQGNFACGDLTCTMPTKLMTHMKHTSQILGLGSKMSRVDQENLARELKKWKMPGVKKVENTIHTFTPFWCYILLWASSCCPSIAQQRFFFAACCLSLIKSYHPSY